ncbi:MAG: alpha/beta hydrolase [Thiobacillus sp.]
MKNIIFALALGHLLILALFQSADAGAEVIENRLSPGIVASANYQAGKPQLPAVILLHGFLQTREFPTVSRLAEGLNSAGYATLTPTLSLGISRRAKSLPCEAAHRHTLEQDVAEISAWVDWLAKQHAGPVVFIGHSYGSLQGLVYAASTPHPALQQLIALSLIDTERHPPNTSVPALVGKVKTLIAKRDKRLVDFALGHCTKFTATPESYFSYANWDRKRVLDLARNSRVPVHVIIGSDDNRMGKDWTQALSAAGVQVDKINGANHFFDAEYEFDLLDLVLGLLKSKKT